MTNSQLLKSGSRQRRLKEGIIGYLFMLPTVIGFTVFIIYPLISSAYYALTEYSGFGKAEFVGLDNFKWMFTKDPTFIKTIQATLLYVVYTVPAVLIFGLLLAVLLNKTMPGIKLFRTIYYLPVVVPAIASLVLWKFIFNPDHGLFNGILASLKLPTSRWLESESAVLPALTIIAIWGCGGQMIVFLSGLQSVPAELYEAAAIDGANSLNKFFHITIPMMTPVLFLQLITGLIGGFQVINPALIVTSGGPNLKTNFLNYQIYMSAFDKREYGYAMALVWVLFVIIMAFTVVVFKVSNSYVYYEAEE
ncbi:sugar ABC transporter permease [Oscillospiraceae bacterium HV4-5-C5C]|nr:sugar ABC transporter permease [Oscillospiraceae bacterium HV4-5-C5C]